MRFLNENIWCLPDILVTTSLSICPLKLTKAAKSQSPSCPCFGPPLFVAYEKKGSAGDITIDVCQGSFSEICNDANLQRAENIYLN